MARWRGVIVQEGIQTGDGRVIAEGALEWAELPLPLAWIRDGDQHVYPSDAPQIGIIDTITRNGSDVIGEGEIDENNPDGAEVVRRMREGMAPGGSRFFISIDPDDWEVEIIATDSEDQADDVLLVASGSGLRPTFRTVRAAAGDPDPGEGGGDDGITLFQDAADSIIERMTRLRIRGATLCSVSAFDGAYIELVDDTAPSEVESAPEPVVAHAYTLRRPDPSFFIDPGLEQLQRWVTIDDETGRIYGHLAGDGECHIGYQGRCLTLEELSGGGFAYAMPGHVVCADGSRIATGPIAVRGGHAGTTDDWDWRRAQAHYDDPSCVVADVAYFRDRHGIVFSGVIRPTATEEQIYAVRASGVSGDWRQIGGQPRLIGACCVNVPGFPKMRAHVAAGELVAVVAAGGRPLADPECDECNGTVPSLVVDHAIVRRLDRLERANFDTLAAPLVERVHGGRAQ